MEPPFMPFNKTKLACTAILIFAIPGVCLASNWQWLKDAPVTSFDEQDWELLQETISQTLNKDSDGDSRQWDNPETGNSGTVKVIDTRDGSTGPCRKLVISNGALPEKGVTRLNYCRQPDGQWKIDPRVPPQQQN
jgi:surface antigen